MNYLKKYYHMIVGKGRVKYWNDRLSKRLPRKFRLAL